jgi:hypothetical protein
VDIFPVVYAEGFPMLDEANHIALHDPADAVRRYEADLRRLERHAPENDWCDISSWPCWEIQDLAASLGIEVSE